MRKTKALFLLIMILVPSYALLTAPPVKADDGYAKVYIISLLDVGGWTFPNRPFDPSKVKEGAITALSFKERTNLPRAHPKLGKSPPFYGISYQVVIDWYTYKSIIESSKGVIVINTHGEIIPVPSGYSREAWADKIAEAMLKRRVTWVHTAGYPFYYAWYQGASQKEDNPPWGSAGFKRLMSHINKGDVECWPIESETKLVDLNTNAQETLLKDWGMISDTFFVQHGRPLKASDFGNYTILPIWGTWDGYMTGGVIAFIKPNERVQDRYGFGAYVHIGTNGTWNANGVPTDGDFYRGYVGAAAAVWTEVEASEPTTVTKEYVEQHYWGNDYTAWGLAVTPVITSYAKDGNELRIIMDFGIYGVMKTNSSEYIGKVEFYLSCPPDTIVMMNSNRSKNGYNYGNSEVGTDWIKWGWYGFKVALFIVGAAVTKGTLPRIVKVIGGAMLASDFFALFPSVTDRIQGVDEIQPPNQEVEFKYDPTEFYTEPGDGYRYGEFESTIHIELRVNVAYREQWTIVPLEWYLGLMNSGGSYVVSTWSRTSIALYDEYTSSCYKATVFFDDFKDLDGWSVGDTDSLAGYDYWGAWSWAAALHCAGVGTNSLYDERPNLEAEGPLSPIYDKGMNAYLTRSIDLRPYRNAWLRYSLGYVIGGGDYLAVEYYSNGVWNNLNTHTGIGSGYPVEISLPTNATQIRFRFYSNDDDSVSWGVRLDYVEIRATLPNDAINAWQDAGNDFNQAMAVSISISSQNYAGYLNYDEDWYQFTITSSHINDGKIIYVGLNTPLNALFKVELFEPTSPPKLKASSYNQISYTLSSSDNPGNWRIRILPIQGFGQYNFYIQLRTPSGGGGGGCPYVYVWNGEQYIIDNNLLPASEFSNGADVEDYYRLEQPIVPTYQGKEISLYSLQIREFEYEHDFIDKVQLLAVDHSADVSIAITQDGEILTYKNPFTPLSCLDNNETSRLSEISKIDGDVSDPTTYFEGYPGDYLILNFGRVASDNAKLILRTDMKKMDKCIEVQVQNSSGMWQTVEVLIPRNYWSIQAVNLSPYVSNEKDLMVKLFWKYHHRLDYVGLDTTPQDSFELHYATLISAIHSSEGNVRRRLLENDQTYAELTPRQQIQLTFLLPSNQNQKRTLILYTEGHYTRVET